MDSGRSVETVVSEKYGPPCQRVSSAVENAGQRIDLVPAGNVEPGKESKCIPKADYSPRLEINRGNLIDWRDRV